MSATADFQQETPQKRGRGRPRIHPPPDPNAPKRPRGRPPKEFSAISLSAAANSENSEKIEKNKKSTKIPGADLGTPLKNSRHEAFARNIVQGKNGRQAYQGAGFHAADRAADAGASECLARPNVAARVSELKQAAAKTATISAARVLTELGKIGFATITDQDGDTYSLANLSRDQIGAMSIKRAALADLGKYLGLSKETLEHVGPGGGPIQHQHELLLNVLLSPTNLERLDDTEIETIRSAALKLAGPAAGGAGVVDGVEYEEVPTSEAGGG